MNITSKIIASVTFAVAMSFAQQSSNNATAKEPVAAPSQNVKKTVPATKKTMPAPAAKTQNPPAAKAQTPPAEKPAADELSMDDSLKKKPRGKITVEEYFIKQKKQQDSILSETYHHGITLMGTKMHDKRYGDFDDGFVWGGGMGMYYLYRYKLMSTMVLQGRFGTIYRYGRFNFEDDAGTKTLSNGKTVDLTRSTEISYRNASIDVPLEFKIGGHIERTTFLYLGLTFGITKPIAEQTFIMQQLKISSSDKNVAKDLEYFNSLGLTDYPLTKYNKVKEPFYLDDWETNGWIGVGLDGKYISAEFQVLVASGSTKDNHRYYHLFHDSKPTWRIMLDIGMR